MTGYVKNSALRSMVLLGTGFGLLFWIVEAGADVLFFGATAFIPHLLAPGVHELWMRLLVFGLSVGLGALAGVLIERRRRAEHRIDHLNRVLRAIRNVNQLITREHDPQRLIEGACRNLVEHRGFNSAWILLFDDRRRPERWAQARVGPGFQRIVEHVRRAKPPRCVREVFSGSGVTVLPDPVSLCPECPLSTRYDGWSAIATRLEHEGELFGVLTASVPREYADDREELDLFQEVAGDAAYALHGLAREERQGEVLRDLRIKDHALSSSVDAVALSTLEPKLTYVNAAFLRMWGYASAEQAVGRSPLEFWEDAEQAARVVTELGAKGRWEGEMRARRPDGGIFDVRLAASLVRDEAGKPLCMMASMADTSGRRRAEEALRRSREQLRQAQRMEAIGRLAGGVAHDFNNLLTGILGYAEHLASSPLPAPEQNEAVVEIRRSAQRAASLTQQLLAFSRKQDLRLRRLDMNALIGELERMLRRLIGEHILLETVLSPGACFVNADKGQIEQVVMNLAVNARDAMPEGGRLTIRTSTVTLGTEECERNPELRPGKYVLLTVNDTGCGMDAETRERIFEPFFTTKAMGQGTGLGLSTVFGIVKQTGGCLVVKSESGRGAEFDVYLPAIPEDAPAEEADPDRPPAVGGGETILLVEDESLVRRMVSSALRRLGYVVIETESGHGAIDRLSRRSEGGAPPRIDLLITDVVMPEMSGPELAEEIRKLQGGIRTLYISGYTENAMTRHGDLQRGEAFLQKPFTPSELAQQVRGILEDG